MIYTISGDNATKSVVLAVDFSDEGVALTGETEIPGGIVASYNYMKFFENDLRNNNAELFVPATEEPIEDEIVEEPTEETIIVEPEV